MFRPLSGLRVVELGRILAVPWMGQILADLGADVVKIESPAGDDTRGWGPPFVERGNGDRAAAYFHAANRGKRSIALDLGAEGDRAVAHALADRADVVIENFKLGGLKRFALDYPALNARNPRVVYASVTGFGQTGPRAAEPGYDAVIQAMGGLMHITGEPDGPPQKVGVAFADIFTALYGVIAVQAALAEREATGRGRHVDLALFDTMLGVLANQAASFLATGESPVRLGSAHPSIVPYQTFRASDGYLTVACGNDTQFARLARALGLDALAEDRELATNAGRVARRDDVVSPMAERLAAMTRAEAIALVRGAGVPAGPVNTIAEAFADPQAVHRAMRIEPGGTPGVRMPVIVGGDAPSSDRPAPALDEHRGEILAELGL